MLSIHTWGIPALCMYVTITFTYRLGGVLQKWSERVWIQVVFIITLIWLGRKSNQGKQTWPHNEIYISTSNKIWSSITKKWWAYR